MLKMGCAKVDITPSFEVYLHGYAGRNQLTSSVEEPIEAGVIALEQDRVKTLIITVDTSGIKTGDCDRICREIETAVGIRASDILICSSHTHFSPAFQSYSVYVPGGKLTPGDYPADEKYFTFFLSKLIPAVKFALADLEEVRLLQADIPLTGIAFNRRTIRKSDGGVTTNYLYPEDPENYEFQPIDPTLHVWKFMRGTHPKGVLARYGSHPVTGGYDFYGISPDYPGYFRQAVQEKMGCPGFFMLGTAGDVVPVQRNFDTRKDLGEVMASVIRLAARQFRETTGFTLKSTMIPFPVSSPSLQGKGESEIRNEWESLLASDDSSAEKSKAIYMAGFRNAVYHQFNGSEAVLAIRLMQLGDRTIAALPFEVLTKIGVRIRERFPDTAVVSCSGGYEGYLPLQEDFPKGGYETDMGTVWAQDTGDRVISTVISALEAFQNG